MTTSERNKRYRLLHKDRLNANQRAWRKRHPDQVRRLNLKHSFGITIDEYERLLVSQNGLCAICRKRCVTGKRLSVDHDHSTGKIRGLLCMKCNSMIGHADDSLIVLQSAIAYLAANMK